MRETQVANLTPLTQECVECRTVAPGGALFCEACGCDDLRSRRQSRFPYDALAAFIGVMVVIVYWLGRA